MNRAGFHRQASQQSCYYYPTTTVAVSNRPGEAFYNTEGTQHLTRPATMTNLPNSTIAATAASKRPSAGGRFIYGAVGEMQKQQQQQQHQPRAFQRAKAVKGQFSLTITGMLL